MIMRLPVPILALQILWLNLVVDVLPAMSLAWEPGDDDIMTQKPRDPKAPIVSMKFLVQMLFEGALIGLGSLLAFYFAIESDLSLEIARTIAFTTMAFGQLFHLFNVRGQHMFVHFGKNLYLLGSMVLSALVMLVAIYLPFLNKVMYTKPLDLSHWLIVLLGSFVPTLLIQGFRLMKNLVKNK
jgi:Ca2+-transporting ATPase